MLDNNFDVLFSKFYQSKYNPDLTLRDLPGAPSYKDCSLYLQRQHYIENLKSKYSVVMFTGPEYTFDQYMCDLKEFRKNLTLQKRILYHIVLKKKPVPSWLPKPLSAALTDTKDAIKFARHDAGFFF